MPYVVVALIILFIFWDELFYAIGGILGLGGLFFLLAAYGSYRAIKLSDDEWQAKYSGKEKPSGTFKSYIMAALICGGLSYLAIDYQTNTWHNPELIAQEEAAKKAEEERLAAEQAAEYAAERNEKNLQRISEFDAEEKNLFDTKFQEYQNAGIAEFDARTKAVDDVNKFASDKAAEKRRAEAERLAAEKAEQERRAAEEKRKAEELAKAEKSVAEEKTNSTQNATVAQGLLNIDSLANANANILADEVINYANTHPDKVVPLKNYVLRLKSISSRRESNFENRNKDSEAMAFNIPIIGGIILDSGYEDFIKSYKNAIVRAIDEDVTMKKFLDNYHSSGRLSDIAYNALLERYLPNKNDVENYNALIKIAAIKYHAVEAYVDDKKTRFNILAPGILDAIDAASYAAFSSKENRIKYQSANEAFKRISTTLEMDSVPVGGNYNAEDARKNYYASLIPKYIFAFELEEIYVPADKNSVYLKNSANSEQRKRIYNLLAGEWISLVTGKTHHITNLAANDKTGKTPRVNYVDTLDKNEPLARFNFITGNGQNVKIFITPAMYVKDGQKSKVLALYFEYELLGGNETTIYKNGRVTNIGRAEDVYIKNF